MKLFCIIDLDCLYRFELDIWIKIVWIKVVKLIIKLVFSKLTIN